MWWNCFPQSATFASSSRRAQLDERTLRKHDAAIVVCAAGTRRGSARRAAVRRRSGSGCIAKRASRGPVTLLSARVTPAAIPVVHRFARDTASAFERLTLAARAWKELAPPARARVLLATHGLDGRRRAPRRSKRWLPRRSPATAPMPVDEVEGAEASACRCVDHAAATAARRSMPARTIAIDRGNHLARWLTALPPNVLDSEQLSARAARARATAKAGRSRFSTRRRCERLGAGAFLAVARANEHRDAGIVRLRYRGSEAARCARRLALVGKGICFDTGGINLKTHKSMYDMHEDMQGSAVARRHAARAQRAARCRTTSIAGSRSPRTRSVRARIGRRKSCAPRTA